MAKAGIVAAVVEGVVDAVGIAVTNDMMIVVEVLHVMTGEDVAIGQEVEAETGDEDLHLGKRPLSGNKSGFLWSISARAGHPNTITMVKWKYNGHLISLPHLDHFIAIN
jgi:hypothetical protein